MVSKKLVVFPYEKLTLIEEQEVFQWKLEKEIVKNNGKIELIFVRNEQINNYEKLVKLEKEFETKIIPTFLTILPAILSMILLTIFLILFLTRDENFDAAKTLILFMIPSSILLLTTVILSYARFSKINALNSTRNERLQKAKIEVAKILKN